MDTTQQAQGFGIIGLIILIVAVALIGFAGLRIYNEKTGADKVYQCGINTQTLKGGCIPAESDE